MSQLFDEKCSICVEFQEPAKAYKVFPYLREWSEKYGIDSRILYEDKDFVIIPSLGPVSECHLLVLPRLHVCSYALLDSEMLGKAERIINAVASIIHNIYGGCVIFEHGTLNANSECSASCNHAHMHIVACSKSIIPCLTADGMQMHRISDLSEVRNQKKENYFYYQDFGSSPLIMDDTVCRSQYLRILLSNIMGCPEKGDWKQRNGIDEMYDTFKKMKDEINKIKNKDEE